VEEERPGLLDRAIELLARLMDLVGLNGSRLQWRWTRRRRQLVESSARTEVLLRSAKGKHKMCRSCRALVARSARVCPECDANMSEVKGPGLGRLLSNVLPGTSSATSLILLVNGLFFVLMLMSAGGEGGAPAGLGRMMGFDFYTILKFGGGRGSLVLIDGEWWRFVAPIFLHGGLLHFGFNTYVLLQLGPIVEELYGTERFWIIYLLSGISGNLVSQLVSSHTNVIGASGAICGLIGLLLAYGMRRGGSGGEQIKRGMMRYAVYILIFSLLPGISLLSHAGGFAGGLLLGLAVPAGAIRERRRNMTWQLLSMTGVLLVLFVFYQVSVHGQDFAKHLN
jgi:rhomboid protease GluP